MIDMTYYSNLIMKIYNKVEQLRLATGDAQILVQDKGDKVIINYLKS